MTILGDPPLDRVALIEAASGRVVTYRELLEAADTMAASMGPDKDLVFVLARNDLRTAQTYATALRHGHAIAFLDGDRPADEYAELISAYRPRHLVGPSGTAAALAGQSLPLSAAADLADGVDGESITFDFGHPPVLHPSLAVLLATSGTTGNRRYVRLSRGAVDANAAQIAEALGLDASERPITSMPLHYSFGLSILHSHWQVGASVVLSRRSVIEASFWEAVDRYGCTSLGGVPFTYQQLEGTRFRRAQHPSLTSMQAAGGALGPELTRLYADHLSERGGRLLVMYGQTEATARMAVVPPDRLEAKLGSAGVALPGARLRIEPLAEQPPSPNGAGRIVYEGPNVMMGYATDASDLARGDELHGTLDTGDVGYLDADGFLYIVGRTKRIAKILGVRISLDELEAALHGHGPAAVLSGEDAIDAYCAFGSPSELERLGHELAERAHVHPRTVRMHRVESIPRLATGKVDYARLEEAGG